MRAVKFLLIFFFLLLCIALFVPRKGDKQEYLSFIQTSSGKKEGKFFSLNQHKTNMVKEIWFNDTSLLIKAPVAELCWDGKQEVTEKMCEMKAEVKQPQEQNGQKTFFRTFFSKEGCFFYQNLTFLGHQVSFTQNEISNEPVEEMSGHAENLFLRLKEKEKIPFDSLELSGDVHLTLKQKTEITCDTLLCNPHEKIIVLQGERGINLFNEGTTIEARLGTIDFEKDKEWRASRVVLEGPVKMSNKENLSALADRAEYRPESREIRLLAKQSPVLFVDKVKGLTVSAKEVLASKEKIYGVGDVHFKLSDEEMKKLKEQFAWKKAS